MDAAVTQVAEHSGMPALDVLYTTDMQEAESFLEQWSDQRFFGLDLEWRPTTVAGQPPNKTALLQISGGRRVLIWDLYERRHKADPLSTILRSFIEHPDHTFFRHGPGGGPGAAGV